MKTIRANYTEDQINQILGEHLISSHYPDFDGEVQISTHIQFKGNKETGIATLNLARVEAVIDEKDIIADPKP